MVKHKLDSHSLALDVSKALWTRQEQWLQPHILSTPKSSSRVSGNSCIGSEIESG